MDTTIKLDRQHFKTAADKARALGTTPQKYIHSLIDSASMTFDEILGPVRQGFQARGTTEEELNRVVSDARKDIQSKSKRESRK